MLDRVEIESLVVRIPGLPPDDANELVARIADELVHLLPDIAHGRRITALSVRVPAETPRDRWPQVIAQQLIASLREAPHA